MFVVWAFGAAAILFVLFGCVFLLEPLSTEYPATPAASRRRRMIIFGAFLFLACLLAFGALLIALVPAQSPLWGGQPASPLILLSLATLGLSLLLALTGASTFQSMRARKRGERLDPPLAE
jgi:hypothetical protein